MWLPLVEVVMAVTGVSASDAACSAPIRRPRQRQARGAVAQLGERLNGIQEVIGSIPFSSTKNPTTYADVSASPAAPTQTNAPQKNGCAVRGSLRTAVCAVRSASDRRPPARIAW